MNLFKHQQAGVDFLYEREGAGLFWDMGVGKTRTALAAALKFFHQYRGKTKIERVIVLCPASVRYAWREELTKLSEESSDFAANVIAYKEIEKSAWGFTVKEVLGALNGNPRSHIPILILSYAMLQNTQHAQRVAHWCASAPTVLIADESSYLKNRTAKQTKGAQLVAQACVRRWLLSGTPVTNSPLDLWGQAEVMYPNRGRGPLAGFLNWYAFRSVYAILQQRKIGAMRFSEVVGYKNLDKLQKRFAPFVSRVTKFDCLDLPAKSYTKREVALSAKTWEIYKELKKDCLLVLGGDDIRPEPNAAVRLLRLAQITSGHVGTNRSAENIYHDLDLALEGEPKDISSEKLDWLVEELTSGELSHDRAIIVWCRWRRERERLHKILYERKELSVYEIYGGQTERQRDAAIKGFQFVDSTNRNILLAQQHAGGFGLNLTVAHTAVYLSNDYSWAVRAQSEDRTHRTGQRNACLYVDVLATGPSGQRTIDHVILEALKEKKDLASFTCEAWRRALGKE